MKTALIIPAYKPGKDMLDLLKKFEGNTDFVPVVVNDGSGSEFSEIFNAVPSWAVLLTHDVNRGKGAALKTAFRHVLDNMPECNLALTADADGQHKYEDILRVNKAAIENPEALILGCRKFEGEVPFRSKFGNGLTRQVFAIASGTKVSDTQTGLRAFGREAMEQFTAVSGERYEYEINMLLTSCQSGRKIVEVPIETVYINDNSSSHFNPIKDSIKIYACILKFCLSSLIGFIVDFIMVMVLSMLTASLGESLSLAISVVGARIISAAVNFTINRSAVFKGNEKLINAILKYAALAICILAANYALMHLFTIIWNWHIVPAKILVEVVLFGVSFVVQGRFVYRGKRA